ncbi:tripartite motif-containing protein 45-like [Ostrea edulis]|uniref:tripartite motif-containing protein 45-like n=1 Tax=Ostrea edulis TaxID=37623 RepID=UPI0020947A18|nr:tripartite motif-containing protein 45-like [Ostrea edulis]
MATATTQAQKLITCDLNCDRPVQQFCNSCQVGLCGDCINKHVNSFKSVKHDIVPFTKRTVQMVFPQCTSHSHQRCEGHCQQCDVPVCIKCLLGPHKGHDAVDITDIIVKKKEKIKTEIEEMEDIVSKNKTHDAETEKKISQTMTHFSDLEKQAKDHRKQWHLEVDIIFDKLESWIKLLCDQEITRLQSCLSKLRNQNFSLIQTVQENKAILNSKMVSDVNSYNSKLDELRSIPQVPNTILPSLRK